MNSSQKINRRKAIKRVCLNTAELEKTTKTFKDIFDISFKRDDFTLFETLNSAGYKTITYKEAKTEIIRFASILQNTIPQEQNYVGIYLENSPKWIYTFYGLLMAGFTPVLLSTRTSDEEIYNVIKKLNICYVISQNKTFNSIVNINLDIINNSKFTTLNPNWKNEIIFMTSGVTDEPKLVSYTGKEISSQLLNAKDIVKENYLFSTCYKGDFKHLLILPFYHIFGLIAVFIWFSFFNVTFVFPLDLKPASIKQACLICKVTHIFAVPLFWNTIANQINKVVKNKGKEKKFNKAIILSLRIQKIFPRKGPSIVRNFLFKKYLTNIFGSTICFGISGGGNISHNTLRIINGLGYTLSNGYGATEIGITSLENSGNIDKRILGSVGKPFKSLRYELIKSSTNLNCLKVYGDSLCNKVMINGHWVYSKNDGINTNDLVNVVNGDYYIKGRLDNLFISSNGENYSLDNLETKINLPNCESYSLIINKENEINLILSYPKNVLELQINKDLKELKNNIELIKLIKGIYITNRSIPMSNGIKIKRRLLSEEFDKYPDEFSIVNLNDLYKKKNKNQDSCNDEILSKIISVFTKHFEGKIVNEYSNFYTDLSGDSLSYFILISELENEFNISFTIEDGNAPITPKDFADIIIKKLSL